MSQPGDDAQRDMERRALRNVRGLLDKIETDERLDRKSVTRIALIAVAVALVLTAFVVLWIGARKTAPTSPSVVIPPVEKSTTK